MELFKKVLILIIFVIVIIIASNFFIKSSNAPYCIDQRPTEDELGVFSCPPECSISSCNGLKTACCPKGLNSLFS